MKEAIFSSDAYQKDYLLWANSLIGSTPAFDLMEMARSDRSSVANSTVLFRPPLNRLVVAELTIPEIVQYIPVKKVGEDSDEKFEVETRKVEEEDTVNIIADFELAQLNSLAISSLRNYAVILQPRSERWPVQYRQGMSKEKDLLVGSTPLRERTEQLVVRTSAAMLKHVVHRTAIGNIPEEYLDWTIDEGILQKRVLNVLRKAGIETYGDLGIQSVNQLKKVDGIGREALEDIKNDLDRRGWLSPAFRQNHLSNSQ